MTEQLPLFSPADPDDRARSPSQPPASTLPATSPALNSGASLNAAILAWRDHLEKERSPAIKIFRAKHSENDDESSEDPHQTQDDVNLSERGRRHSQDHDVLLSWVD